MPPRRWLLRLVQGILVGSGAILPGISGGVLCVLFGIYQPMMALFAHPFKNFRRVFPQLFPVGVGWVLGFFAFAKLITLFFNADSNVAIWLFLGLIAGSFPSLYRQAGHQGHGWQGWTSLAASFAVMAALFYYLGHAAALHITPNPLWFCLCGVLWGLSLVIPGMSSSSTLIFLGLFEPMTAGIAAVEMGVVLPIFIGAALTVILMSRLVNGLFETHYRLSYHAVLGFVAASTVVIIPRSYDSVSQVILCLLCGAVGFAAAWFLSHRPVNGNPAGT